MPNSIQPTILRQTCAHLLDRLLGLHGQRFEFVFHFFVADFDLLLLSNLFEDERRLDFAQSAFTLASPEASEIHALQVLLAHALGGQSAKSTLEAHIHLLVDHGVGNRKVVAL